jgi:hypothetical protein
VTVRHGKAFFATLGGHTAGTFGRDTVSFPEMTAFLEYDDGVDLLVLGALSDDPVVLQQIRGTFIGGRFSRAKTAIFLGRRLWAYLRDWRRVEADRFYVVGMTWEQLVCILTYVDDGNFSSFVWCRHCLYVLAQRCWGADMGISEEEWGMPEANYSMRFLDVVETYDITSHTFSLRPFDRAETPLVVGSQSIPLVRYAGPAFVQDPIRYLRSLMLGRLARIHQVLGLAAEEENEPHSRQNLGRMVTELVAAGYTPRQLRTALASLRQAWVMPAVRALRDVLRDFEL